MKLRIKGVSIVKKILSFILFLFFCVIFMSSSCLEDTSNDADEKQRKETERIMDQVVEQVGLPDIQNFFEYKMSKEIYELRDDSKLVCYAYSQALDGRFIYLGPTIGFGLPYSVQMTNPEKEMYKYNSGYGTLPQAEVNGLFMPEGLSATWVMYIDETTGKPEVMYMEPTLTVRQTKFPRRLVAGWSLTEDY